MNRYYDQLDTPRPETFLEVETVAAHFFPAVNGRVARFALGRRGRLGLQPQPGNNRDHGDRAVDLNRLWHLEDTIARTCVARHDATGAEAWRATADAQAAAST